MATPLGHAGWEPPIPDEAGVQSALETLIPSGGLYMFPGHDMDVEMSKEEEAALKKAYAEGPVGILIWHPDGAEAMTPKQFGIQAATNLAAVLVAAILLSMTSTGFLGRFVFVILLGTIPFFSVHVPYWNWFGFPNDYTMAQGIMDVIGWAITGVALAAIVKPSEKKSAE